MDGCGGRWPEKGATSKGLSGEGSDERRLEGEMSRGHRKRSGREGKGTSVICGKDWEGICWVEGETKVQMPK
jgi:hypothetical protein